MHKEKQDLKIELHKWLNLEEEQPSQKSREIRLQSGDKNTKFFHASIKVRQNRNFICHLYTDTGSCVSDMYQLRNLAPEYFSKIFNQSSYLNVFPKLVVRKHLTADAQNWLIREVTREGIMAALFQMNPEKAPGPDGFNLAFYQRQ